VPSYSEERKQQILNKLLPPSNMTIAEVSRNEGIGVQTVTIHPRAIDGGLL
jgi:predicted transcriptional regulator